MAFSIMCMFLTVLYAGFAGLTFAFSKSVLEELLDDEQEEIARNKILSSHNNHHHPTHFVGGHYNDGYIGERFDVVRRQPPVGGGFAATATDSSII
jgi:hypothetical protein